MVCGLWPRNVPARSTAEMNREAAAETGVHVDPRASVDRLLRDLRSSRRGLTARAAVRRQVVYGPNALTRRGGRRWPRQILGQLTQPLALLLWLAAVLS